MHYMDNDTRRQLVREHTQGLADEMLAQRLRRGTDGRAPAYDS